MKRHHPSSAVLSAFRTVSLGRPGRTELSRASEFAKYMGEGVGWGVVIVVRGGRQTRASAPVGGRSLLSEKASSERLRQTRVFDSA